MGSMRMTVLFVACVLAALVGRSSQAACNDRRTRDSPYIDACAVFDEDSGDLNDPNQFCTDCKFCFEEFPTNGATCDQPPNFFCDAERSRRQNFINNCLVYDQFSGAAGFAPTQFCSACAVCATGFAGANCAPGAIVVTQVADNDNVQNVGDNGIALGLNPSVQQGVGGNVGDFTFTLDLPTGGGRLRM